MYFPCLWWGALTLSTRNIVITNVIIQMLHVTVSLKTKGCHANLVIMGDAVTFYVPKHFHFFYVCVLFVFYICCDLVFDVYLYEIN